MLGGGKNDGPSVGACVVVVRSIPPAHKLRTIEFNVITCDRVKAISSMQKFLYNRTNRSIGELISRFSPIVCRLLFRLNSVGPSTIKIDMFGLLSNKFDGRTLT